MGGGNLSNLDLVKQCDDAYTGLPYYDALDTSQNGQSRDYIFAVDTCPVGYMDAKVVARLQASNLLRPAAWTLHGSNDNKSWTNLPLSSITYPDTLTWPLLRLELTPATPAERSKVLADLLATCREKDTFISLKAWRDELYPIYGPDRSVLCCIERAGSGLFGVNTYGVHMNVYTQGDAGEVLMWVPRRAANKPTYPGMLDNSVAGGLGVGEKPLEGLVREAAEEASLDEELVRSKVVACGTVSYHFRQRREPVVRDGVTHQPEMEFIYDLEVGREVLLRPGDGEVETFELMGVGRLKAALRAGEFKPNSGVMMLDFFVRHGILTAENEPDYLEISYRLHRKLPFPTM
ncbi:MAG: hypothetical protein M1814_000719 [Vezdaea aestivalis]|nr:MAG: hypothetical protein M1814_000719 [Vezdaea aestivalis]